MSGWIWMVTQGDYSDYGVLAVFTREDAACAYAAYRVVESGLYGWGSDPMRVGRIKIDPEIDTELDCNAAVVVTMNLDTGGIVEIRPYSDTDGHLVGETWRDKSSWSHILHTIIAYSPHADYAKIAGERRAQWLAQQEQGADDE